MMQKYLMPVINPKSGVDRHKEIKNAIEMHQDQGEHPFG